MQTIKKTVVILSVVIGTNSIEAQDANTNKDGVANSGYDIVNYFVANSAERGSKDYAAKHKGATYYFVNAENLKAFEGDPEKYLPQFNGYCAFAVAKMNQKVPVDPKTFRVDDGKLYLFYNDFWEGKPFNTMIPWINNESELEKLAYANWQTLKKK